MKPPPISLYISSEKGVFIDGGERQFMKVSWDFKAQVVQELLKGKNIATPPRAPPRQPRYSPRPLARPPGYA